MGRGVDFRFAEDAFVIILNYDCKLRSSIVTQMVGRGSRTQNVQSGHVFCNHEVVMNREPGFPYLKDKEKTLNSDIGPQIAGSLVQIWNTLSANDKKGVAHIF